MVYFFDTRRWPMVVDSASDFNICEKVENEGESGERKHVFDLNISTCMWKFLWVNVCKLYLDLLYVWFYADHNIQVKIENTSNKQIIKIMNFIEHLIFDQFMKIVGNENNS